MNRFVQIWLLLFVVKNIFTEALPQTNNQGDYHRLTKRWIRDGNIDRESYGYRRGIQKERKLNTNYIGGYDDASEEQRFNHYGRNFRTRDGEGRRYKRSPIIAPLETSNQEYHHSLSKRGIRDGNIDRESYGYRRGNQEGKLNRNYIIGNDDSSEEERFDHYGRNFRTRDGEGRRYRRSPILTPLEEGLNREMKQANHHHREGEIYEMDYEDDEYRRRPSHQRRGGHGRGHARGRPENFGGEERVVIAEETEVYSNRGGRRNKSEDKVVITEEVREPSMY